MPVRRRRIYYGERLSRRRRIENYFNYSIVVAIALLVFTGPVVVYRFIEAGLEKWRYLRSIEAWPMLRPPTTESSLLQLICAFLASLCVVYLAATLSIRWKIHHSKERPVAPSH